MEVNKPYVTSRYVARSVTAILNAFFGYSLSYLAMIPAEYILEWDGECPVIAVVLMGKGRRMASSRAIMGVGRVSRLEEIAKSRGIPTVIVPRPCPSGYTDRPPRWCLKRLREVREW